MRHDISIFRKKILSFIHHTGCPRKMSFSEKKACGIQNKNKSVSTFLNSLNLSRYCHSNFIVLSILKLSIEVVHNISIPRKNSKFYHHSIGYIKP